VNVPPELYQIRITLCLALKLLKDRKEPHTVTHVLRSVISPGFLDNDTYGRTMQEKSKTQVLSQ
jgi:hypothetical protein